MATIIPAFEQSPDGGKGLARDTCARCARGGDQHTRSASVSFGAMKEPAHLALPGSTCPLVQIAAPDDPH